MTYCFNGYPLSGKSTLAKALAERLGVGIFSSGNLARSLGMKLEESISKMDLSMEFDALITEAAVAAAMRGVVVDGFPRSISQVRALKAAGVSFKVIFVLANPLLVFDRIRARARQQGREEDREDVVAGRLRRAMEFKKELEAEVDLLVFNSDLGLDRLMEELGI